MDDSAPWKTEETIIGLSQLPVLSIFFRFGGCHIFIPLSQTCMVRLRGLDAPYAYPYGSCRVPPHRNYSAPVGPRERRIGRRQPPIQLPSPGSSRRGQPALSRGNDPAMMPKSTHARDHPDENCRRSSRGSVSSAKLRSAPLFSIWRTETESPSEQGVRNRQTTFLHQCARNGFLTLYPPPDTLSAPLPLPSMLLAPTTGLRHDQRMSPFPSPYHSKNRPTLTWKSPSRSGMVNSTSAPSKRVVPSAR